MSLYLRGWPDCLWYWRAIFSAVSVASEPPESSLTATPCSPRIPAGAISRSRVASSMAGGAGAVQGRRKVQGVELVVSRLDDALVAIAQAGHKDTRQAIEIPAPLPILQPHALAAHEHPRLGGEGGHLAKVQHQMVEHVRLVRAAQ